MLIPACCPLMEGAKAFREWGSTVASCLYIYMYTVVILVVVRWFVGESEKSRSCHPASNFCSRNGNVGCRRVQYPGKSRQKTMLVETTFTACFTFDTSRTPQ